MGMRGPAPQPEPLLRARGSQWPDRREREAQQSPAVGSPGRPSQPKWLDKDGKECWRHIVPLLEEAGVLSRIDRGALAAYCSAWSQWRAAQRELDAKGPTLTKLRWDPNVEEFIEVDRVMSPEWKRYAAALELVVKLQDRIGLSPSARARVKSFGIETPDREHAKEAKKDPERFLRFRNRAR